MSERLMAKRILVVDDDRSNCAIVAKMLTNRGYEVDVAYNGPAALELIKERPYALAILDYQMPGMNGLELFQEIRRIYPDMPALFLTAFATLDTVYPAVTSGVAHVSAKPADAEELIPLVADLVSQS